MDFNDQEFRCGFCALIGKPNAGKSTFMNQILGQKIAAVSPRPQTTRKRQLGIFTTDQVQIIFVDTPGVHLPKHKLGQFMMDVVQQALSEVDIILWMVDLSTLPEKEDILIAEQLTALRRPPAILMVCNKTDTLLAEEHPQRLQAYQALAPKAQQCTISALRKENFPALLAMITQLIPYGPPHYDPDQVTDLFVRDIASDLIREAALYHLKDEIPHSIAVRLDEFKERSENLDYLSATILVERDSHKGIVIGKGGAMLKLIGQSARQQIESMSGKKAYLELRVKVDKDWMNNPNSLHWLGYNRKSMR